MHKPTASTPQPSAPTRASPARAAADGGPGNSARAEMLGLHAASHDAPGADLLGRDLATTTAGQTTLSEAAQDHPQRSIIEAHEAVHRQQHQRYLQGAPAASREALEAEAQRGSEALAKGQPFEATLGVAPATTLAFTPILAGLIGCTRDPPSDAEADLRFLDDGGRAEDAPPLVNFGSDGAVGDQDREIVQLAFDAAYRVASSPECAEKLDALRAKFTADGLPGAEHLTQKNHLAALARMNVNLADATRNDGVRDAMADEEGTPPTAGFTPLGSDDIYIRQFAIEEGREALAGLLFHEALHVAGFPDEAMNGLQRDYMEPWLHDTEAALGLPFSAIVENVVALSRVEPFGDGIGFRVAVKDPGALDSDRIDIQILDGNRDLVFTETRPTDFSGLVAWDGTGAGGERTESGIHSIRVVSGSAMYASEDVTLRRSRWSW